MEILIRNYQLFWNMPQYQPEDMIKRDDFNPVTVNEEENVCSYISSFYIDIITGR